MRIKSSSSPFGGTGRTRLLLALRLLSESYPRELARVLAMPFSSVQKALRSLERDGLVAGRPAGRTRGARAEAGGARAAAAAAADGEAALINARSGLGAVAVLVGDTLRRHGIRSVLTGGACASLPSGGRYQSVDMDFILMGPTTRAALDAAMATLGFRRQRDRYVNPRVRFYVEFPRGPLAGGGAHRVGPAGRGRGGPAGGEPSVEVGREARGGLRGRSAAREEPTVCHRPWRRAGATERSP